ncbi:MAG TPA: DUF4157 domain-containing protein [Longimicrobium sp.]
MLLDLLSLDPPVHHLQPGPIPTRWRAPFERSFQRELSHVMVEMGPAADRRLARTGAIAQAVDASTVLVSTTLAGKPAERLLPVLGHELAHTVQFGRGGASDGVAALEAEAWLASRRALAGLPHRVRGRASAPLCATALIDVGAHPMAPDFYERFKLEPLAGGNLLHIDRTVRLRGVTLEGLLDCIIQNGTGDYLIVVHGTSFGLYIPLTRDSGPVKGDGDVMALLDSARSDKETAEVLLFRDPGGEGAEKVRTLRKKAARVKALKLHRLELRACSVGGGPSLMMRIRDFFGAQVLGAPDIGDAYSPLNPDHPNPDLAHRAAWCEKRPGSRIYEVAPGGWVTLGVRQVTQTSFQLDGLSDRNQSVGTWAGTHLALSRFPVQYPGGPLPVHALFERHATYPLIFPGEEGYAGHIRHT